MRLEQKVAVARHLLPNMQYKIITTMLIQPLDDHKIVFYLRFTHLELRQKLYGCSLNHFTASQWFVKCTLLTFWSTSNLLGRFVWLTFEGDFQKP